MNTEHAGCVVVVGPKICSINVLQLAQCEVYLAIVRLDAVSRHCKEKVGQKKRTSRGEH